jgi:hypothetical protein
MSKLQTIQVEHPGSYWEDAGDAPAISLKSCPECKTMFASGDFIVYPSYDNDPTECPSCHSKFTMSQVTKILKVVEECSLCHGAREVSNGAVDITDGFMIPCPKCNTGV